LLLARRRIAAYSLRMTHATDDRPILFAFDGSDHAGRAGRTSSCSSRPSSFARTSPTPPGHDHPAILQEPEVQGVQSIDPSGIDPARRQDQAARTVAHQPAAARAQEDRVRPPRHRGLSADSHPVTGQQAPATKPLRDAGPGRGRSRDDPVIRIAGVERCERSEGRDAEDWRPPAGSFRGGGYLGSPPLSSSGHALGSRLLITGMR
jgi:hypothetical protein